MQLVYLVAGLSSRFGGSPKGLCKLKNDKTIIECSIEQALSCLAVKEITFIVSNATYPMFHDAFGYKYKDTPVSYSLQSWEPPRSKPWGTADALTAFASSFDDDFAIVCNGDDMYGKESFNAIKHHMNSHDNIVIAFKMHNTLKNATGKVNRGEILMEEDLLVSIDERLGVDKTDTDFICNVNLFVFNKETLCHISHVSNTLKDKNLDHPHYEILLPSVLKECIDSYGDTFRVVMSNGLFQGVTYQEDLAFIECV